MTDRVDHQQTSDYTIFGKGSPKPQSSVTLGSQKSPKFLSSYQANHIPIKPTIGSIEGKAYIEKSKKRMRESKIFKGKALDAVDNHATKPESSYQVAVCTEKAEIVSQEKGI